MRPGLAIAVAAAALGCAHAAVEPRLVDLTHPFGDDTLYWPNEPEGFVHVRRPGGRTPAGYWYESHTYRGPEHAGTHVDAPVHFHEGGASVERIPLERLVGPGVDVDVRAACRRDRDHRVSVADLRAWEKEHGAIPDGAVVLLHTGFGALWPDRAGYLGTDLRGAQALPALHFPGLHPEAARWLVEERGIRAVGLDTASIDHGPSQRFETHQVLSAAGVPIFENVAHLDALPARGFRIVALPMAIRGGSGSPLRIVALLDGG